jgi:hypothetical protein
VSGGGEAAHVHADLGDQDLGSSLRRAIPTVEPPPGLAVAATGTSRPHYLLEARYGSHDAGEAAALSNGLTYTTVARCGGFEDRLYAVKAQAAGTVHGKPAIVTSGLGGNGLLAWEPAPGVVAISCRGR